MNITRFISFSGREDEDAGNGAHAEGGWRALPLHPPGRLVSATPCVEDLGCPLSGAQKVPNLFQSGRQGDRHRQDQVQEAGKCHL